MYNILSTESKIKQIISDFVHKLFVENMKGFGSAFRMNTVNHSKICTKCLYISDTTINGNNSNRTTGTTALPTTTLPMYCYMS